MSRPSSEEESQTPPSNPPDDEDDREAERFEGLLLHPEVPATPRTITNLSRMHRRVI
jgi:hypothetical protein